MEKKNVWGKTIFTMGALLFVGLLTGEAQTIYEMMQENVVVAIITLGILGSITYGVYNVIKNG